MVFCAALNCLNNSKSKVSTFFENEKKRIKARQELSHLCGSFYRRLLQRKSGKSDFKPLRLHLKEDAMPTIFLFGKEITGKNAFRSTKTPCPFGYCLTKEVKGMHFAPFLFYLELDRVFVMIISTFTVLVWLVMIKY